MKHKDVTKRDYNHAGMIILLIVYFLPVAIAIIGSDGNFGPLQWNYAKSYAKLVGNTFVAYLISLVVTYFFFKQVIGARQFVASILTFVFSIHTYYSIYTFAQQQPVNEDRILTQFRQRCANDCETQGNEKQVCNTYCRCIVEGLRGDETIQTMLMSFGTSNQQDSLLAYGNRTREVSKVCLKPKD